jgi:hypothetical protein
MMQKRLLVVVTALVCLLPVAHAANWDQPAADLARQIAALTGPGPARLTLGNDSSLAATDIPVVRRLLERSLRSFGVLPGSSESATLIRVTLSENLQGGLWVAEVVEGAETRVTMLPVALGTPTVAANGPAITLRRTLLLIESSPVLDAQIFTANGIQRLVVLEPDRLVSYMRNAAPLVATGQNPTVWLQDQTFPIAHGRPYPRDLRGRLVAAQDHLFDAYLPGVSCSGSMAVAQLAVTCQDSDDPWPISPTQRAFYNAMRGFYTGILAPGYGMDLAPFYEASDIPRASGSAMLLNGVDGRVMLIENNVLRPVSGANDWGSDFAMLRSGCGSGSQVLVSGSGAAAPGDSLRAWEIVGREAIAVSAPISVDGTVMAIQGTTTQGIGDGNSATVIVRRDAPTRYEVWNASALCN